MLWRGSKEHDGVETLQDLPMLKFEAKQEDFAIFLS
jgi:hypothetical protein